MGRCTATVLGTACVAALVAGCATTAELAPPVSEVALGLAVADGAPPGAVEVAALERGRHIYLTTCTHCHAPEQVTSIPSREWPGVLDQMRERSGLDATELADVTAYVLAVGRAAQEVSIVLEPTG